MLFFGLAVDGRCYVIFFIFFIWRKVAIDVVTAARGNLTMNSIPFPQKAMLQ